MTALNLRRFAVAAATLAFALGLFFHPLKPAYACSCVQPAPPLQARDQSQTVFAGAVAAVEPGKDGLLVTFDVAQSWKGPVGPRLTLATSGSSASCGFEFVPGEEYLVYGYAQDGQLHTGLCTRTAPLANAGDDLAALGPGVAAPAAPAAPPAEVGAELPWRVIALAGGAALLLAAGIGAVALRRRRA
jgi:hypothetical protein